MANETPKKHSPGVHMNHAPNIFYYNQAAEKIIIKNGTKIADVFCCGQQIQQDRTCAICKKEVIVNLRGLRNQTSQTYQWQIFIGEETEPIASLTCAYCLAEVVTENRQCECSAFCSLILIPGKDGLEVHRQVSMEMIELKDYVHIDTQTAQTHSPAKQMKMDLSGLNLYLGDLSCVATHAFNIQDNTHIDVHGRCDMHKLQMQAVLVLHDEGVYVQRRAKNFITGIYHCIPPEKSNIAQLRCPWCLTPIVDRTLLCSQCKTHFVDVVIVPDIITNMKNVKISDRLIVKIEPRWAWDTERKLNALVMEGDNWKQQIETHPQETTDDPLRPLTIQEKNDHSVIYQRGKPLLEKYRYRGTAEILGISKGKLEYAINKFDRKI